MMAPLLNFMTSRAGIVLTIALALFSWHKFDKSSAVREAVVRYVASVELEAAEAETKAIQRRLVLAEAANTSLRDRALEAEQEMEDAQRALETYLVDNPLEAGTCSVDGQLLGILRSD